MKPGRFRLSLENFRAHCLPFAAVILLAALAVRLLPWQHVFTAGRVYFYDPDCFIRLRKIFTYINAFPQTYVYDYFQGYPKGTGVISSPIMEYLIALLSYPFHKLPSFTGFMTHAVALAPAVVGALTAAMLFFFVSARWGKAAGLASGLVLALHPKHVEATLLGRFDNEMLEPLLLLVTFWGYIISYERRKDLRFWMLLGVLQAVYLMAWRGALFPLFIMGLDLILRMYSARDDGENFRWVGKGAGAMYMTAALLVGLICITDMWGTRGMFSFNIISWFHVALFVCAGLPFIFLSLYHTGGRLSGQQTIKMASAAVILAAVMVIVFSSSIREALKVIVGGNAWIDSISQYRPMEFDRSILYYFGFLSILAPLALLLLKTKPFAELQWKRFLVLWTIIIFATTLTRDRYAEYFALNVAILAGVIVFYLTSRHVIGKGTPAVAVIGLLCLQTPTYTFYNALYESGGVFDMRGDIEDTMLWLRDNTPLPGDPYRPATKPGYGVMARWDYGGWIESIALRPSIATNYGTETYGMEEVARFLLTPDETELHDILRRNGVRYLVVDKILPDLPMYAKLIGKSTDLFTEQWNPQLKRTEYLPSPKVFSLISSRLFFADGSQADAAGIQFLPVEGVRLVYESSSPVPVVGLPWEIKKIKIFEVVDGATINAKGLPGTVVNLSQRIVTNQGRSFVYNIQKRFDKNGRASFKVSYAGKKGLETTGAVEPPQIICNGRKQTIAVQDADIVAGRTIEADLTR